MACDDPFFFFFGPSPANSAYKLTVEGPAGQFTVDTRFRDANTGVSTEVKVPPGTRTLDDAPGKSHVVTILLFLVKACEVTVKATCHGETYCKTLNGSANDQAIVTHVLPME